MRDKEIKERIIELREEFDRDSGWRFNEYSQDFLLYKVAELQLRMEEVEIQLEAKK